MDDCDCMEIERKVYCHFMNCAWDDVRFHVVDPSVMFGDVMKDIHDSLFGNDFSNIENDSTNSRNDGDDIDD